MRIFRIFVRVLQLLCFHQTNVYCVHATNILRVMLVCRVCVTCCFGEFINALWPICSWEQSGSIYVMVCRVCNTCRVKRAFDLLEGAAKHIVCKGFGKECAPKSVSGAKHLVITFAFPNSACTYGFLLLCVYFNRFRARFSSPSFSVSVSVSSSSSVSLAPLFVHRLLRREGGEGAGMGERVWRGSGGGLREGRSAHRCLGNFWRV